MKRPCSVEMPDLPDGWHSTAVRVSPVPKKRYRGFTALKIILYSLFFISQGHSAKAEDPAGWQSYKTTGCAISWQYKDGCCAAVNPMNAPGAFQLNNGQRGLFCPNNTSALSFFSTKFKAIFTKPALPGVSRTFANSQPIFYPNIKFLL